MERATTFATPLSSRERTALAALLAFAAALRWIQWSRAVTLFNDGPEFLALAQSIAAGDVASVLAHPYHPLYSGLAAALHGLGFGWETAAAAVGVAGGTAAVGFLFLFVRDAFGAPPAWIAAGLLAVHSRAVEYASDIQSDGLYLGLFLAGVWLGWRAWTRGSARDAAFAGLASGLAYLTRPEGLGLACVLLALAALEWVRGAWRIGGALRVAGAAAAAAALCVAPYMVALEQSTGSWTLTHKKTVSQVIGTEVGAIAPVAAPPPRANRLAVASAPREQLDRGEDGLAVEHAGGAAQRAWAAARMLWRTSKSAFRYGMLALLVAGLVAARGRPSPRAVYVGAIAGAYAVVLYGLTVSLGYVSRRHALPPLVPLFGYAGLGAVALGGWLARGAERRGVVWARRVAPAAAGAALALAIGAGELATQREPRRGEERAARDAAEWLRANAEPAPLAASRLRLGYYASMPFVPLVRLDTTPAAALDPYFDEAGVRYVLVDEADDVAALERAFGPRLRLLHASRDGDREAWVFERVAAAAQR